MEKAQIIEIHLENQTGVKKVKGSRSKKNISPVKSYMNAIGNLKRSELLNIASQRAFKKNNMNIQSQSPEKKSTTPRVGTTRYLKKNSVFERLLWKPNVDDLKEKT